MNYKKLIDKIAAEHGVSSNEVDTEIKKAIKATGSDIKPEIFISMLVQKVKQQLQ